MVLLRGLAAHFKHDVVEAALKMLKPFSSLLGVLDMSTKYGHGIEGKITETF